MTVVGKTAAVLRHGARPILRSGSQGIAGIRPQVNLVVGFGSMIPLAAGALGVGLLTRSHRRGLNFFSSTWPPLLLATNGIRINVVGAQNLTSQRPAVFLYNHRNGVDPFIASALVQDNFIKVAKKELARDPIIGTMLKFNDAVFLDRDDSAAAVETLHEVEKRMKEGLSVVIAPEGTSSNTTQVGPFKKGAFRIAMTAGVPIVPIVIRNAEIIASRDASLKITPGTVDVAVLPAIPVGDWTLDTLPDRIAEVRQLYLDTLADWPTAVPGPDVAAAASEAGPAENNGAHAHAGRADAAAIGTFATTDD